MMVSLIAFFGGSCYNNSMPLEHEPILESSTPPAAQTRVTPEEFAAAIKRIEDRREANRQQFAGTIPIGEALHQLDVEATPEEVLAEVQAARTVPPAPQVIQETAVKPHGLLSHVQRLRLAVFATLLMTIGIGFSFVMSYSPQRSAPETAPVQQVAAMLAIAAATHIQVNPTQLQVLDVTGRLRLLAEVGDDEPVQCTITLSNPQLEDYTTADSQYNLWTVIKHDGRIYLRGWTRQASPQEIIAKGLNLNNVKQPGYTVLVTLPLDGFIVYRDSGTTPVSGFHADDVQLDRHAWEQSPLKDNISDNEADWKAVIMSHSTSQSHISKPQ